MPPDPPLERPPARGRAWPPAIAWFGFSAFWGHMRHLLASAIATDNVDSRQWMAPEPPDELLARAVRRLRDRGAREAPTLAGAMGGTVWIDFVSDTGDDVTVSERVAELVAREYEVDDGGRRERLPRGDVLFLGGDLAYPVATVREVTRRLVEPWNRVLSALPEEPQRLLLAVPGNHDWYDGLDGFARLCQAPMPFEDTSELDPTRPRPNAFPVLAWAEAFAKGVQVAKPRAMALSGYVPVQRTSYFRLPLARDLELFGVDRQLKQVDERQKAFFAHGSSPGERRARMIVVPDPARAFGDVSPHGEKTLSALGVSPSEAPTFVLAGDIHHYERSLEGESLHVVAGGGGAFLHGARIAGGAAYAIVAEFPGKRASRALLARLPATLALGGSGWLVLIFFAVMSTPPLLASAYGASELASALASAVGIVYAVAAGLLVGLRKHRAHRVVPFSVATGAMLALVPVGLGRALASVVTGGVWALGVLVALGVATIVCGGLFGAFLALLAAIGVNHEQPWAALGVPGFKCFVRMRVREIDGEPTRIDAWVIGQVDPVRRSPPRIVDRFAFSSDRGAVD